MKITLYRVSNLKLMSWKVTLTEMNPGVNQGLSSNLFFVSLQVHGHHPPPAAEAVFHRDSCGDQHHLGVGSASGLPSVPLLINCGAARTHSLFHRLA